MPRLSIAVPVYDGMVNGEWFYQRLVKSLEIQTFTDWELVVTKEGAMAHNTNMAILASKGEYIKILYQDDYLAHERSLELIVEALEAAPWSQWLVSGCVQDPGTHSHLPTWNDRVIEGVNTIGSPSVLTIKNENPLLFDERLSWLLDCVYYKQMNDIYGQPIFLNDINVAIGVGEHQTTHIMPDEEKLKEHQYIYERYT